MEGTVGTNLLAQVGFIVKDIETTKRKWAEFLGVEVPETRPVGDYAITQTEFMGQPAPEAAGLRLVQHGVYGDGSGEYNYLDAPELKCIVELLESYQK